MTEHRRCRPRCWFSLYGFVGVRTPTCMRCGRENPRPLTDEELRTYVEFTRGTAIELARRAQWRA